VTARFLVVAVFVLAAAAAGDAFRGEPGRVAALERPAVEERATVAPPRLVLGKANRFRAVGPFLNKRVLRAGKEHLPAEAVEAAFPGDVAGPLDISKVAVAPDGTLVLAVYRFPLGRPAVGALQFWRDRRLLSAFEVPTGYFGGGLAFSRDGRLVALFSHDGGLRGVYDRGGRLLSGLPDSFLSVG